MNSATSDEADSHARSIVYDTLDPNRNQIRILELLPSKDRKQPIVCNMRIVSLDDKPEYDALSWCWGDPTPSATLSINGVTLQCSENLAIVLPYLRDTSCPKVLWVDAVCINQKDLKEKSTSIPLLARVYKQAQTVRIWLGEAADGSDDAVEMMKHLQIDPNLTRLKMNGNLVTEQQVHSFVALLNRPWFERIWVMQEIALSTRAVFYCGDATFTSEKIRSIPVDLMDDILLSSTKPFEHLGDFANKMRTGYFMDVLSRLVTVSQVVAMIQDGQDRAILHPIQTLCQLSRLKATDLRDKVYGCLGMLPGFSDLINPHIDYTWPVEVVYAFTTYVLFCHTGCLYPLCYTRPESSTRLPNLPTWSLDFSSNTDKNQNLFQRFSATVNTKPWKAPTLKYPLLWVRGTFLDEIVSCHHVMPDVKHDDIPWHWNELQRYIHGLWRAYFGLELDTNSHAAYVGGGSMENAYWRTVVCDICPKDKDFGKRRRLKWSDVEPFVQWVRNPNSHHLQAWYPDWDKNQHAETYAMASHLSTGNKNAFLFKTKRGFIGISVGHPSISVGNHLYFLDAGDVPMALRPTYHSDGEAVFEFASECYVHGLMDGEAFKEPLDPLSKRWKQHELRRNLFGGSALDTAFPVGEWKDIALV